MNEHLDVVIVGAGLAGIGAAVRLRQEHPQRRFVVLESRGVSGGTWDLFRYPGVRSDSDMLTMAYRWRPWRGQRTMADGASILTYLRETAREYAVDRVMRLHHRVTHASWDGVAARWVLTVSTPDGRTTVSCDFLWLCSGYFDYDHGYEPRLPGLDTFRGRVVHPQHWPDDLDVTGRRVVVVGSGATAVTLVPALAETAAHVTMLQRSPSYVLSAPSHDRWAARVSRLLPARTAYRLTRERNIALAHVLYRVSRRRPDALRRWLQQQAVRQLPEGYDVDRHFRPAYDPWDQRLCLAPDGDLFAAIRSGRASVVTDTVDAVTSTGVITCDGTELSADVIVTATGLRILPLGGITFTVDGVDAPVASTMTYRSLMLAGLPNLAYVFGYTNASWTLKVDLVADYVCRLLTYLDDHGYRTVVPVRPSHVVEAPFRDFTPGYLRRAAAMLPRQGSEQPWRVSMSYVRDRVSLPRAPFEDGVLVFGR